MSESRAPEIGINSWLEDELYQQYLNDRKTVDESWKEVFETNGGAGQGAADSKPAQRDACSADSGAPEWWACSRFFAARDSRASADRRRDDDATARRCRSHRREHECEPEHSACDVAARDAGEGDRRESPHSERTPRADRQEQDFLHAHHRVGHREGAAHQSDA